MRLRKPPALRYGDTIGIIAPASPIRPEPFELGLQELRALGFQTRFLPDIFMRHRYTAGTVDRRLREFEDIYRDTSVRAVFCARGGYGCGQLLPRLALDELLKTPKIILGSSDITIMLGAIANAGVVAFHGPMVAASMALGSAGYNRELLLDMLVEASTVSFPWDGVSVLRSGSCEGRIAGGCLSLLAASVGTPFEPNTEGAILFLEDIDTKPYQVDRLIGQLKQAGKFEGVAGVVFGEMPGCIQTASQGYTLEEVVIDLLEDYTFPILFGFPAGHTAKPHLTLPIGVDAMIDTEQRVFRLLEPAVERTRIGE